MVSRVTESLRCLFDNPEPSDMFTQLTALDLHESIQQALIQWATFFVVFRTVYTFMHHIALPHDSLVTYTLQYNSLLRLFVRIC